MSVKKSKNLKPFRSYEELREAVIARQNTFSKRIAQVARYCLNHPEEVAINTLVRISEQAQVPPATITRFAKELGFSGFTELQGVFRERLLGPQPTYADKLSGLDARAGFSKLGEADLEHPESIFGSFVQAAVQSLLRIEEALDRDSLAAFVKALADSDAVHVSAARGAFGLGAYTVYGLSNIGKRAHLVDNLGAMRAEQISAIGPTDVLLVMTFDDYTQETIETAKMASDNGRTVLAITDNEMSPVTELADHVLYVAEARLGHFRSQVPAMVVCQAVIVSLAQKLNALKTDEIFQNTKTEKLFAKNQNSDEDRKWRS